MKENGKFRTFGQEGLRDKGNEILKELGWPMDNVTAPYPSMTDAVSGYLSSEQEPSAPGHMQPCEGPGA